MFRPKKTGTFPSTHRCFHVCEGNPNEHFRAPRRTGAARCRIAAARRADAREADQSGARLHEAAAARAAHGRVAHQRRQSLQPALLAADADQPRQRQGPQGQLAHPLQRLRHRAATFRPGPADRVRRRDLLSHGRKRRVRHRRRDRRDPVVLPGEAGSRAREGLLRLGEPRRRAGRGHASTSASSTRSCSRWTSAPARCSGGSRRRTAAEGHAIASRRCTTTAW